MRCSWSARTVHARPWTFIVTLNLNIGGRCVKDRHVNSAVHTLSIRFKLLILCPFLPSTRVMQNTKKRKKEWKKENKLVHQLLTFSYHKRLSEITKCWILILGVTFIVLSDCIQWPKFAFTNYIYTHTGQRVNSIFQWLLEGLMYGPWFQ